MQYTILIIDDEKNIREGLGAALEMEGYKIALASDGKAGLERLVKGDIDLVITDLRMPEVSGEQVLAKVTAENPGVPVIVLTGHGSIDSAVDAMRNGAYDFLTKPLNLDQLVLIVKRAGQGTCFKTQRTAGRIEQPQVFRIDYRQKRRNAKNIRNRAQSRRLKGLGFDNRRKRRRQRTYRKRAP